MQLQTKNTKEVLRQEKSFLLTLAETLASLGSARASSIFNMIFEFSAVFTCYSTYYKPIAKKVGLARPRARRGRAVRAKWDFFTFMNLFYQYI